MFIIGKIISDGDTNFTQHKYNKLQKICPELCYIHIPMLIYYFLIPSSGSLAPVGDPAPST